MGFHRQDEVQDVVKGARLSRTKLEEITSRLYGIKSREVPPFPASYHGGVTPMTLRTRFQNERARLGPDFTEKWRKWRIQWIKDQALHPLEPVFSKENEKARMNPFRRAFRWPGNQFQIFLGKFIGERYAFAVRHAVTFPLRVYLVVLYTLYFFKYHGQTWEVGSRLRIYTMGGREPVYPGDPAYPFVGSYENDDYHDLGFKSRTCLRFKPEEHEPVSA